MSTNDPNVPQDPRFEPSAAPDASASQPYAQEGFTQPVMAASEPVVQADQAAAIASPAPDTRMALDLLSNGAVAGAPLITHRFPIERLSDAILQTVSRQESLKSVITFD